MASDLMKAMFGKMQPESRPESRPESDLILRILTSLHDSPKSRSEIAKSLGHKSISGAMKKAIKKLLMKGLIAYTVPDKPQSRLQKYQLTEKGHGLLAEKKRGL